MEEVRSSILLSSTPFDPLARAWSAAGFALGGFVAGEGSFFVTRRLPPYQDGSERRRFVFSLQVAQRDEALVDALRAFVGGGSKRTQEARRDHWQPCAHFAITSNRQHLTTTIPFADRFLLASAKRDQYLAWKSDLVAYLEAHPTQWAEVGRRVDSATRRCADEVCAVPTTTR